MGETNFTMVPNDFIRSPKLDPYEKTIWIYLKSRQGANESAWPSQKTIAKETSIGHSTVKRKISSLIQKGLIRSTQRFIGQEQTTNLYSVQIPPEEYSFNPYQSIESPPKSTESYKEYSIQEDSLINTPSSRAVKKSWKNLRHDKPMTASQKGYLIDLIIEFEECSREEAEEMIFDWLPLSEVEAHELIHENYVEAKKAFDYM